MPKFGTTVALTQVDGNAFAIMGAVKSAIKSAGASQEQIDQYLAESMSGDYDNLIRVACSWVEVQ